MIRREEGGEAHRGKNPSKSDDISTVWQFAKLTRALPVSLNFSMWSEYDRVKQIIRIVRTFTNNNRGEAKLGDTDRCVYLLVDHVYILSLFFSLTIFATLLHNYILYWLKELMYVYIYIYILDYRISLFIFISYFKLCYNVCTVWILEVINDWITMLFKHIFKYEFFVTYNYIERRNIG